MFLDLQVIHLAHHPVMDVFDKLQNLQTVESRVIPSEHKKMSMIFRNKQRIRTFINYYSICRIMLASRDHKLVIWKN